MPLEKVREWRNVKRETFTSPTEKHNAIRKILLQRAKEKLVINTGTAYQRLVLNCVNVSVTDASSISDFSYAVVGKLWDISTSLTQA